MAKAAHKVAEGAARYFAGETQGADLLLQNLDLWTAATRKKSTSGRGSGGKIELAGIKKLRELILELAVRGKLVPQDPSDEPASALMDRIQAEKAQLIAEGKLKKQKLPLSASVGNIPFELPESWAWVTNSVLGRDLGQQTPKTEFTYIDVAAINNVSGEVSSPSIVSVQNAPSRARKIVKKGTVIYSTVRPYLKNIAVVAHDFQPAPIASTAFAVIHPWEGISSSFIVAYLRSPSFVEYVESVQNGIAYPAINDKQFFSGLFPLPPTAEQHRIVAKVDELMAHCDQLEQQSEQQLSAHQQLVETLLGTLTNAQNADELAANWQRLAEHFDLLFSGPMGEWAVERLKDTILQLAVMGKLVPQDPNDEPASLLLERIQEEKARLIAEGKLKKQKPLPTISEEQKPFELPEGWEWVRLLSIAHVGTGATPSRDNPSYYQPQDHTWVTSGETSESFVLSTREKVSELAVRETNVSIYPVGTLIVAMYGQGKTRGQITELRVPAGTNQACAAILLVDPDESHRSYVKKYFQKSYEDLRSLAEGGAQPNLNVGKVSSTLIPLPPIAEQERITTKVDELFRVCDELILKIRAAGETELTICDVLVEKALVH